MVRYSLLVLFMIAIASVAYRDWFRALCLTIPLLAFLERPDMPREMLGIVGLNPYNILLAIVILAWILQRNREHPTDTGNSRANSLLIIYLLVLGVATIRALIDFEHVASYADGYYRQPESFGTLFTQAVINTVKWIIPGLLVYKNVNSKQRIRMASIAILVTGLLLSLQIISKMLPALYGADDLATRALRVLDRDLGYHRVDLAAVTASVAWAFIAFKPLVKSQLSNVLLLLGFSICSLAMVLTGGRAGILSWCASGAVLAALRWRKLVLLLPVAAVIALIVIPGLQDRLLEGFSEETYEESAARLGLDTVDAEGRDRFAITSGRIVVWPRVIDTALDAPLLGHGRYAMQRTGLSNRLTRDLGIGGFGHPHNAYLELFIDTGLIGTALCLLFIGYVFSMSAKYFRQTTNQYQLATAGLCLSFLVVHLVASFGSQSFYPKQSSTLLWIAVGVFLGLASLSKKPLRQASEPDQALKRNAVIRHES